MSPALRRRVHERDRNLGRVRRITRAVAATSVGACAAVAGLAVGSTRVPLHTAATTSTGTASAQTTTTTTTSTSSSTAVSPASSSPTASSATPVATSGGS